MEHCLDLRANQIINLHTYTSDHNEDGATINYSTVGPESKLRSKLRLNLRITRNYYHTAVGQCACKYPIMWGHGGGVGWHAHACTAQVSGSDQGVEGVGGRGRSEIQKYIMTAIKLASTNIVQSTPTLAGCQQCH